MNEDFDNNFDDEELSLVNQFEEMQTKSSSYFFDIEELEVIIDYYFDKDQLLKAQQVIKFALKIYPDSTSFLLKKAQLYSMLEQADKAFDLLNQIENLEPYNPEIYVTRASLFNQKGNHQQAVEELTKALEYTDDIEDNIELYQNIAYEYENLNNYQEAINYLKKAHTLDEKDKSVLFELAYCYESCNQTEESISSFKKIIAIDPYSKTAWFNLGVSYSTMGLFEKAIECYDYAIAIDEKFSSAYFNKANALSSLEQYDEAIEIYREVLQFETPDALTHYYIGECYQKIQQLDAAINQYRTALEINPKMADAYVGIGVCHELLGQDVDALKCFLTASEIEPANPEYWYLLGLLQHKHSMNDDAIFSYQKVIESDQSNKMIWLDYSSIYNELGEYDKAINILSEGIKLFPNMAELQYRLSIYLFNKGRLKEAYVIMDKALQLDADKHTTLFEYQPELKNIPEIIDLISNYQPKNIS